MSVADWCVCERHKKCKSHSCMHPVYPDKHTPDSLFVRTDEAQPGLLTSLFGRAEAGMTYMRARIPISTSFDPPSRTSFGASLFRIHSAACCLVVSRYIRI